MNDVVNDTISRNIRCLEQGAFQSFCQEFFKIHFCFDFERRGATSDGNTRAGTPDYLLVADNQVCLQISVEDKYWSKNEKKPKHDIDRCIVEITDISKIILCSNQGIPTNNTDAKKHIINYTKSKKQNIEVQCFSLENFERIISYNLKSFSSLIKEPYFQKQDIEYLQKYYHTKDDYINWCKYNLKLYENFINYNEKLNIQRNKEKFFYNTIGESNGLIYLVSPSGNGKSNLCCNFAKKYIENNKFALWVKPDIIRLHDNYEHWIIDSLKEANVNFREDYFPYFKELYTRDGLLLIIDDINTIINKDLKNKLSNISSTIIKNKCNIRIICPIWTQNKEDYNEENYKVFYINNYNNTEAENALDKILLQKNINLQISKKKEVIKLLNNDPYLIGLMEELSSEQIQQLSNKTADQVCKLFIDSIFIDIENNNSDFFAQEYKNALYSLIYDQINNNRQNIKLSEIIDRNKIQPILKNAKICKLDGDKVIFRHDRLKHFLQVQALLNQEQVSDNILSNPYYNGVLGEYIAYANLSDDKIKYIQKNNPIAILNTINYIDFNTNNLYASVLETFKDIFIDKNFDIFTKNDIANSNIINIGACSYNIEFYANQVLVNVNNKDFLNSIEHEYKDQIKELRADGLQLLQFKYGNLIAGINYYHRWLNSFGELYINNYNFNQCIIEIKSKFSKEAINNGCRKLLEKLDMPYIKTALIISALLEVTDINSWVENIWNNLNKDEIVAHCIFSLLKCYNSNTEKLLESIINYWLSMNDEYIEGNSYSPRSNIYGLLSRAIYDLSDDAIEFLIDYAKSGGKNEGYIVGLLQHIDNPKVYAYKVKYYADNNRFILSFTDRNKIINLNTLNKLKAIWTNKNEENKYRYKALSLYAPYITNEDLVNLRELETLKSTQNNIYILACELRARLCDKTVTKNLCELIIQKKNIEFYIVELQHIWDGSLKFFIVDLFNNYENIENASTALSELLIRIDKNDAEDIALSCFEKYKDQKYFQEALIIIGSQKTFNLLNDYIKEKEQKIEINLRLLYTKFTSDNKAIEINEEILNRIAKLAPYIISKSLAQIIRIFKSKISNINIYHQILKYVNKEDIDEYNLNSKDDIFYKQKLDEIYTNESISNYWDLGLDYNKKYSHITENEKLILVNVLHEWFVTYKNLRAFKICSDVIELLGERKNLYVIENLLNTFENSNNLDFAQRIFFNAKYLIESESLI